MTGAYRAVVVGGYDTMGRLQVTIPLITGKNKVWASPAWTTPHPDPKDWPSVSIGDGVWVLFELGDPAFPVWFGFYGKTKKV